MPRPPKRGLDYFYLDVDIFDDERIMKLLDKFSTDGLAVYIAILCIVYKNGYYFEADSEESIVRKIYKELYTDRISRHRVREVLQFCGVVSLLDSRLLCANVVTSPAIQRRYNAVTVRNKADKSKYWLLSESEEEDRALSSVPENIVSATETAINVTETSISATETTTKEKKKEITTTTLYIKPPRLAEIADYFKREAYFGENDLNFLAEAEKFAVYNQKRGWDCLPDWKLAADLWAANYRSGIGERQ